MNSVHFFWEHSPLWLLPAGIAGIALAWWQYSALPDFGRGMKFVLGGIRALVYTIAVLLLLNPLLRYFRENRLPPVSVILVDNSRSVLLGSKTDSLQAFRQNLDAIRKKLEAAGTQVYVEDLAGKALNAANISFREESTNLEAALQRIRESYESRNLSQVIIASDGIINQGSDLQDLQPAFRVHTIGMGNPVQARDLLIRDLRHNKVAYPGNQFPVVADIRGNGLKSNQVNLLLREGARIIENRTVTLSASGLARAEFFVKAEKAGMHEYQLQLEEQPGEITLENNRRTFFVEVIQNKQKILLLAASPHPDLKAIRNALEPLEQVELTTCLAGIDQFPAASFNLVLLHQLPDRAGSFAPQLSQILKSNNTPVWLIATAFTDFGKLRSEASAWLNIQGGSGPAEECGNRFDENFQGFRFEEELRQTLSDLPPVKSPGASYHWNGNSETILHQILGKVATPTPLLSAQLKETASRAVFWGDGLWLWRLNEYGRNENSSAVDNLIQKTCLLLLSERRKKQLMLSSQAEEYGESEIPSFRIETFNRLMEPVYNQKVNLRISGNNRKQTEYNVITTSGNPLFRTESLKAGAYRAEASAVIDGKEVKDEINFIVKAFDLEARQLEANHILLKELAAKGKGRFHRINEMSRLGSASELPPPVVEFTEWNENILSLKTILFLLIGLLLLEWIIRKWNGIL